MCFKSAKFINARSRRQDYKQISLYFHDKNKYKVSDMNTVIRDIHSKILCPKNFSHILKNRDFFPQRSLFGGSSAVFCFSKQVKQ